MSSPVAGFVFVGRQRELGLLTAALRHPPSIVLIEGEAGIGKSRLVYEATGSLAALDGRVLMGLCHPLREPVPFGPVVDALAKAGALLGPVTAIPRAAGALAPLLPDLAGQLPEPPPPTEDAQEARRLTMLGVRSLLAAVGRAVLVIEDVHWVDEVTRELLLLFSRDMPAQLTLVLTYRAEDLRPGTPLLGSAFAHRPGTHSTTMHLTPLTRQDVRELALDALGTAADATLGKVLYDRSGGLPLVVEEDLITLREQGRQGASARTIGLAADLEHAELPHGLRESLTERMTALSPAGAAIVAAAAVLAVPAAETLLTQVAELSPEEGSRGVTEALQASVLRETDSDRYTFRHALAQQVAYQHIAGPLRTRLHRQAIQALQAQSPPPLVQIAHHTLALGDRQAWLGRAEAAADQAIALGDAGTAATLLHQILNQPGLPPDVTSRTALALAAIAVNGVAYEANAAVLRQVLADPRLPAASRGSIRLSLGRLMLANAGDRKGLREIARAIDDLTDRPELAARAMITMAIDERDGASDQAWAWIHRADDVLRASPDEGVHAALEATRLTLTAREGDPGVWAGLDRMPRRTDNTEVQRQTARAVYNVGEIAIELGHDRRAAALLAEGRDLARRATMFHVESLCRIALVRLEGLGGDWAQIEKHFAELRYEYPEVAMVSIEEALLVGLMAAARGQRARALGLFNTAASLGEMESQVTTAMRASAALVAFRLAEGATHDAWALAAPAVGVLRRAAAWPRGEGLVPVAVEAALAHGDRDFAEQLVADTEHGLRGRDAPAATAEFHLARGILQGDSEAAIADTDHARQLWADIGRPYDYARATERLGFALAKTRPDEAVARFDEAIAEYTRFGATHDVARCQHTLKDLGLFQPSARGRHGYGDQLSPREQQVAELLAQGAKNGDIAKTLFLSPRTVEQHVARVLKKLGAARKDVAEALRAAGG